MGKQNCIELTPYLDWVRLRVKTLKLPYPWDPSMSFKPIELPVVVIFEVDKLKETIKALVKENTDLQSNLGKVTLEKENLKLNLNQKRERALKEDNDVQVEQHKKRNV